MSLNHVIQSETVKIHHYQILLSMNVIGRYMEFLLLLLAFNILFTYNYTKNKI